ncbi:1-acyl-sn-glycerol-3-phosphate acyltransferase [Qipengyuania nanhaisediminis]|uniref:1-acyl-sn-glycerol-3-phosphate acyltransferases n=1 Tax=Qipengyuania nanhaisediminis TaxID=604088 RepID=A0A1I5KK26_9SPHN|nr:1-acyl-sn-glycerol-3-phosphate acyltransferase [Qipengyuania nanhaisediminis]SFO85388.1 1-acyl-sn-glycerol-3-phosphate acyltransferases [Qipengyuania nanhaisediminis]
MSERTSRKRSILSRIVRRIIMALYRFKGWKLDGHLPNIEKFVIAGAPHTSNWDFVFFVGATAEEGVEPNFMGKHTLFQGMMRNFMFDMGGIPIDRTKRSNVVEQVAAEFDQRDHLALVIAAEGTRSSNGEWKSGFYNIARAANVPIVPAWVCNEDMVLGFGPAIVPTESYGETLLEIARFMRSKRPDYERYKVLEAQALRLIEEEKTNA